MCFVNGAIGQPVGQTVVLPWYMNDTPSLQPAQQTQGPLVQCFELFVLNPVQPVQLPDQELGIALDTEPLPAQMQDPLQPQEQPLVFGDIIRGPSEVAVELSEGVAVRVKDDRAAPRLSWVSSGCPVDHEQTLASRSWH